MKKGSEESGKTQFQCKVNQQEAVDWRDNCKPNALLQRLILGHGFVYLASVHESSVHPKTTVSCRGYSVAATQVILMASPLSTMLKAIRERRCDSFHPGLCIMGFVMSLFWTIYAAVSTHASLQITYCLLISPSSLPSSLCRSAPSEGSRH